MSNNTDDVPAQTSTMNTPAEANALPARRRALSPTTRKEIGVFVLLLVVCVLTYLRNHDFVGAANLENLSQLVGIYGIFSMGAAVVIITGGIDLTVGSICALEGVLVAMALTEWHWGQVETVAAALLFTMGLGLIHGLLITKVPLQPFIVTLCGLMIYRGLARFVTSDSTEGFGDGTGFMGLMNLATGNVHNVPNAFIIMAVIAIVMWVVVQKTVYGRYLYAVGRNEEASRYSGINSARITASAYVVAGLLTGVAGILLAFYTNSISPSSHGNSYELYGIAASVLGGCSLRGGEGSIFGVLIGTTLLQVLQNLVNLLGIPSSLNFAVVGTVILIGVIADAIVKRRSAKAARQA